MPSPFPGMDPWLENPNRWAGVHLGLIFAIQAQLNRILPGNLAADVDEYVWVAEDTDSYRELLGRPDAFVPEADPGPAANGGTASTLLAGSVAVTLPVSRVRKHRAVKVVTADGRRVLTVLEILSPSNKRPGPDRDAYLGKRREYFAARANVVEIDLLRDGDRLPMGRPRPPTTDYYVMVSTADSYPAARVWPFTVRDPFPQIPVPLSADIAPVPLDLRACLDLAYEGGGFQKKLVYDVPANPPLRDPDAEWAVGLLTNHARKLT
ncbi:MAG: DUF4058 family protein [Fimbriiglobus sp.]